MNSQKQMVGRDERTFVQQERERVEESARERDRHILGLFRIRGFIHLGGVSQKMMMRGLVTSA